MKGETGGSMESGTAEADKMSGSTGNTGNTGQPQGSGQGIGHGGITRVSKACEPCRTRKTRCDIATQAVCSECLKRGQAEQCTLREKARPNRPLPSNTAPKQKGEKRPRSSSYSQEPASVLHSSPANADSAGDPPKIHLHQHPTERERERTGPSVSFDIRPQTIRRTPGADRGFSPPTPVSGPRRRHQPSQDGRGREPPRGAIFMVESVLEEQANRLFDLQLNVALRPENVFNSRPSSYLSLSELGLTPGDPSAVQQAHHWINTHFRAIHHNTPFLYLPQVLDIATKVFGSDRPRRRGGERLGGGYDYGFGGYGASGSSGWGSDFGFGFGQSSVFAAPDDFHGAGGEGSGDSSEDDGVGSDDLALLYAILALGSLREQTYDSRTRQYKTLDGDDYSNANPAGPGNGGGGLNSIVSPASNKSAPSFKSRLAGQSLFRMAQDELDSIESPSETAVQALFLLHMFVSNTSMSRRSRDYVARAVMMAHEIGLNRRLTMRGFNLDLGREKMSKGKRAGQEEGYESSKGKGKSKTPSDEKERSGVNGSRRASPDRDRYAPRRRAILYLYVYFSDVYLSALESHPPLIKRQDYDHDVFDPIDQSLSSGIDTPSGTPLPGLRAFVDLITTIGGVLEKLHQGYYGASAWKTAPAPRSGDDSERESKKITVLSGPDEGSIISLVLQLEAEMDALRERLGEQTFMINLEEASTSSEPADALKRTATAGSLLRQMHFNWSRIALRAPFLRESLLKHSSLAVCASSAKAILHFHRHVIDAGLLNLPWMQLRRVTVSVYIVFIALWAGEMPHAAAALSVNNTLDVLAIIGTRWKSAGEVTKTVLLLAEKSGLTIRPRQAPVDIQEIDLLAQLATQHSDPTLMSFNNQNLSAPLPSLWPFDPMSGMGGIGSGTGSGLTSVMGGNLNLDFTTTTHQGQQMLMGQMPQQQQQQQQDSGMSGVDMLDLEKVAQFNADLAAISADTDFLASWHALQQPPW